jgi:transposase
MSKLSAHGHQKTYFRMLDIPLHHLYRALDQLAERKEELEAGLYDCNYVRVNKQVDVVFYDVTTIHFESVEQDELRDFGFSKNGKFNEVQVVMGMITDSRGLPVGYELFKGNTFDGKTLLAALANIKKRFGINRVIIVADRGINSKNNLNLIKEAGYDYIVAAKLKNASAALQEKALSDDGFIPVTDKEGNITLRYKTMEHENIFTDEDGVKHIFAENLVVSYSPQRAGKDRADRERLVEKAKKLLQNPELIKSSNKRGGKKYINQNQTKMEFSLAEEKIGQDARFDGFYAIQTSQKSMSAKEVMEAYSMLWKIEESFRVMKSNLEIRPVYHSAPIRIEGHFVVCFLAYLMERRMELLLKNEGSEPDAEDDKSSPNRIRKALNSMQLAAIPTSQGVRYVKTKTDKIGARIFKCLKINTPNNISTEDELIESFKLDTELEIIQLSFY